jgi:hypothetical protein
MCITDPRSLIDRYLSTDRRILVFARPEKGRPFVWAQNGRD